MPAASPALQAPREREIRAALRGWIAARAQDEPLMTAGNNDLLIVDELAIKHGEYRVDLCAIGDDLHGFEIKSDQDTLSRLPAQAKHFSLVFQRMTLVIGPALLAPALTIVPKWWGLVLVTQDADGTARFAELRTPGENPKPNQRWLVRLLWRDELVEVLRTWGHRGWSKLKYWEIADKVLGAFEPAELVGIVATTLRCREDLTDRAARTA